MSLTAGSRLGPYEVISAVGSGGMGDVYKAKDTRLDRTVAIKVLPAQLAGDSEFRERFEREARNISALDHPNICALYDIGRERDAEYLVMQFLEGETLAARLLRGPMPVTEALKTAAEIASALDSAHRHGIVHRDLKPGNIMLVKSPGRSGVGQAKLLDFGLAKQAQPAALSGTAATALPTVAGTAPLTARGTILGTFEYMAPEQLEGKDADARTDIFAFGAVLFEMLTGRRPFQGTSQVSLIGAILKDEPPAISASQPVTPPALDWVVRKCLAKDPDARWQSAGDLLSQLEWISQGGSQSSAAPPTVVRKSKREFVAWAAAAVMTVAAGVLAAVLFRGAVTPAETIRFEFGPPPDTILPAQQWSQAVSPDGRHVVMVLGAVPQTTLVIRSLNAIAPRPLPGTEGAAVPFWSPDSRFVGFFSGGKLKKTDIAAGPPMVICDVPSPGAGADWNRDNVILFGLFGAGGGLHRVAAVGGSPTPVRLPDAASKELGVRWPVFLPDGRHFLYVAGPPNVVHVGDLDSKSDVRLFSADSKAVYSNGHLLFNRQATLFAQPFDVAKLATTGDPFPVADRVGFNASTAASNFTVSANDVLVYRSGSNSVNAQFTWVDRSGRLIKEVGTPGDYRGLDVSPDGRRIATHLHSDAGGDLWTIDDRGAISRFTFDGNRHYGQPIWSPDGLWLAYAATGSDLTLLRKNAGGAGQEERITDLGGPNLGPTGWSHDSRTLLYSVSDPKTQNDIWAVRVEGDKKPFPVLNGDFVEAHASLSPDDRWLVYQSSETGRPEIYVQPFPATGAKWQISTTGGGHARWRQDGKEIFYLAADRKMMAVDVSIAGNVFKPGVPKPLFDSRAALNTSTSTVYFPYAVVDNGQRFLVATATKEVEVAPLTVVVNWSKGLKK